MPYSIKKQAGKYKVCKKVGDKKCLPGSSKSKAMALKRIAAVYANESYDDVVNRYLKQLLG